MCLLSIIPLFAGFDNSLLYQFPFQICLQHPPDLLLVHVLLKTAVQVLPPLEEHGVADELEPGSELERWVVEELLELVRGHVLGGLNLVGAGVEVDVCLDEEDVVHCVYLLAVSPQISIVPIAVVTHPRARPIFRHWEPCSESLSGTGTSRSGPAPS